MQTNQNPENLLETARYIASNTDFDVALSEMANEDVLSIDTEFLRERTYFPQLCLIQVASPHQAWCIDAITIDDLSPFMKMCQSTDMTKILHSARQDMEIFCMQSDDVPMPIFDTQIAATFTGRADQISYAALVEELFGVSLDKSQTRTNWVKRPLREEQITYALNDVVYLNPMREMLIQDLEEKGRRDWFEEDSRELGNAGIYNVEPQDAWQKVKGAGSLSSQAFKRVMALAGWRETKAKHDNLPRSWVIKDGALMYLAENPNEGFAAFEQHGSLSTKQIRLWGDELREILSKDYDDLQIPLFLGNRGLDVQQKKLVKAMGNCIKSVATNLNVPPSLLANRKEMERLARGAVESPIFCGWRNQVVGEQVRAVLEAV
jgi:ribonuclease D